MPIQRTPREKRLGGMPNVQRVYWKKQDRCQFCTNEGNETPIAIVNETRIMSTRAKYHPNHTMVVPEMRTSEEHVNSIFKLRAPTYRNLIRGIKEHLDVVEKVTGKRSLVFFNEGPNVSRSMGHLHGHVIPEDMLSEQIGELTKKQVPLDRMSIIVTASSLPTIAKQRASFVELLHGPIVHPVIKVQFDSWHALENRRQRINSILVELQRNFERLMQNRITKGDLQTAETIGINLPKELETVKKFNAKRQLSGQIKWYAVIGKEEKSPTVYLIPRAGPTNIVHSELGNEGRFATRLPDEDDLRVGVFELMGANEVKTPLPKGIANASDNPNHKVLEQIRKEHGKRDKKRIAGLGPIPIFKPK